MKLLKRNDWALITQVGEQTPKQACTKLAKLSPSPMGKVPATIVMKPPNKILSRRFPKERTQHMTGFTKNLGQIRTKWSCSIKGKYLKLPVVRQFIAQQSSDIYPDTDLAKMKHFDVCRGLEKRYETLYCKFKALLKWSFAKKRLVGLLSWNFLACVASLFSAVSGETRSEILKTFAVISVMVKA